MSKIHYGIILHFEKEELEYYEYYKNQVDMRLVTVDTDFMYEVDDIPMNISNKVKVYTKNGNLCLILKEKLTNYEMMNLLECSKIIYKG